MIKIVNPTDETTEMGPIISERQLNMVYMKIIY
jgi:acyl-CoA reductase-like NAD-dependent aldehyde dehydrogenase